MRVWPRVAILPVQGLVALLGLSIGGLSAQPAHRDLKPHGARDPGFAFCSLKYLKVRSEADGAGWNTDYPNAGHNLSIRLWETTAMSVTKGHGMVMRTPSDSPRQWVVDVSDPVSDGLSTCPFSFSSDVGTLDWNPGDVERLRAYLLKGGFLWVDDFWGDLAWSYWQSAIGQVLDPAHYPIRDVPLEHPIFHQQYQIREMRQSPNNGIWRARGVTSERGEETERVNVRAISDAHGRMMVLMTHNTDVGDIWEREADPVFFEEFAAHGYAFGVNVILYAMSH